MIQASILEQITIFYNILINNSKLWILLIAVLGLVSLLILASRFHNRTITKVLYALAYIGVFGTLIYFFHTEILELFDYLANNIFLFLFFPNLAVYALVLVIVNLIIVKSTFSEKDNKVIKIFNITFFIIFNVIFYLIIDNVIKNNVNVYEQLSIYTNNDLLVLIELSMKLFIVWLIILGIIKITRSLILSIDLRENANQNLLLSEINNKKELKHVNSVNKILEINPDYDEIKEVPSKYNDFMDIVPIKKHNNLKEEVVQEISENHIESLEEDIETLGTIEENNVQEMIQSIENLDEDDEKNNTNIVNPFENIIFTNDNTTMVLEDTLENRDIENKKEDKKITLSSYDSIFINYNQEVEDSINNNMKVLFDDDSNYLQNILLEIDDLKNNTEDEEKINSIYNNIKSQEDKLTLNDYNCLINKLLTIKK